MLTEVRLYGHLGQRFGKVHYFAVNSVAQAMSALSANFEGFRQYMVQNSAPGYYVIAGKNQGITEEELAVRREFQVLKIVPAVEGRKAAGGFQMILGAALMVIGVAVSYFSTGLLAYNVGLGMIKYGAYLFVGGLSAYLSQPPRMNDESMKAEQAKSYAFDGAENTMAQGGPVPVVYGLLEVGSVIGAMGLYTEDLALGMGEDGDDEAENPDFHIATPFRRTELDPQSPEGMVVSIPCTAVNGIPPYTFSLVEDDGRFELVYGSATITSPEVVPMGSYRVRLRCTDVSGDPLTNTVYKDISIQIGSAGNKDTQSSMYIPPR